MKSFYWLLATLLVPLFSVYPVVYDRVQNDEYHYKIDKETAVFIDNKAMEKSMSDVFVPSNRIQKFSSLSSNGTSMSNYETYIPVFVSSQEKIATSINVSPQKCFSMVNEIVDNSTKSAIATEKTL